MESKLIVILSQAHLSKNPRVLKEALALNEAGYRVHILTSVYDSRHLQHDRRLISGTDMVYEPVSDLSVNGLRNFSDRLRNKAVKLAQRYLGWESPQALGYGWGRYLMRCRQLKASLYICHQELPTLLGIKLMNEGYKVGFDLEDWYSEDLLPEANQSRPIRLLKKAESAALNRGIFCLCPSAAMAKALQEEYHCAMPQVIYNAFDPVPPQLPVSFEGRLELVWFSQTVGTGRGLEEFIAGMNTSVKPCRLTLIGNCRPNFREKLESLVLAPHVLSFISPLAADELMPHLARYDLGLAPEWIRPRNRNLTVSNKLFQYIGSGIPVLASHTLGQDEVMNVQHCGWQVSIHEPQQVGTLLDRLDRNELLNQRAKAIEAVKILNWQTEKQKLLQTVRRQLA